MNFVSFVSLLMSRLLYFPSEKDPVQKAFSVLQVEETYW